MGFWNKHPRFIIEVLLIFGSMGIFAISVWWPRELARRLGVDVLLYGESLHGVCIGAYRQGTSYCLRYVVEHREGYAVPGEDKWWVKKVWITEKVSPRTFIAFNLGSIFLHYIIHYDPEARELKAYTTFPSCQEVSADSLLEKWYLRELRQRKVHIGVEVRKQQKQPPIYVY